MKHIVSFKKIILALLLFSPLMQESCATNARSEVDCRIKQLKAEIDKLENDLIALGNAKYSTFKDVGATLKAMLAGGLKPGVNQLQPCINKLNASGLFSDKIARKREILDAKYQELHSLMQDEELRVYTKYKELDSPMEAKELKEKVRKKIIKKKEEIADTKKSIKAEESALSSALSRTKACLISIFATTLTVLCFFTYLGCFIRRNKLVNV